MTTWVKVVNSMPAHPKLLLAGDRAGWLFLCGLCYSNEHLTDGFIARHVLPIAAPGVKHTEQLAHRLVTAGLWHEVDDGWQIHDYDGHQRSSDEIRDRRSKDAERKAALRTPRNVRADSARTPVGVRGVEGRKQKAESREEGTPLSSLRADVVECFAYWQERCGHPNAKLTDDRRSKIEARLRDGYTVHQIRQAIDGAARGAFVNDAGTRFDDIELICRKGSKLEDFMQRSLQANGPVRPLRAIGGKQSPSDLIRKLNESEAAS